MAGEHVRHPRAQHEPRRADRGRGERHVRLAPDQVGVANPGVAEAERLGNPGQVHHRRQRIGRKESGAEGEAHAWLPVIVTWRSGGGVCWLRPATRGSRSIRTAEMPGRSPLPNESRASLATEPLIRSSRTMSAGRPTSRSPCGSAWARATLPVAIAIAISGGTSATDERYAISRRIPPGVTPVPPGAP